MRILYVVPLVLFISCGQTKKHSDKKEFIHTKAILPEKKVVKFLWRDKNDSIIINHQFCKTISDPEKAALAYVATFIGNDCSWDGDYTLDRSNLKCEILTALDLGYQCSQKHLGFLRKWFKNDTTVLKTLEGCPTTTNTSTIQETFDEIVLTNEGNGISVFFKASGFNMREEEGWNWAETDFFKLENSSLKLVKKDKSKVKHSEVNE